MLHLDQMCIPLGDCLQLDEYHYYDFDYLIRLYSDAFGEENLIVLPYELLVTTSPPSSPPLKRNWR